MIQLLIYKLNNHIETLLCILPIIHNNIILELIKKMNIYN
jgi:hypothetical protein